VLARLRQSAATARATKTVRNWSRKPPRAIRKNRKFVPRIAADRSPARLPNRSAPNRYTTSNVNTAAVAAGSRAPTSSSWPPRSRARAATVQK
jgi:hypothetical protein